MRTRTAYHAACALTSSLIALGCAHGSTRPPIPAVARGGNAESQPIRDTHETLQGVLWMQTAAEYWAVASASYRIAEDRLRAAFGDKAWTAAIEQRPGYEELPGAVILDLDETVLDNSPMQGQLVLDRTVFSPAAWRTWVSKAAARLVPGARDFVSFAESQGVRMFFVTNRTASEQDDTLRNLSEAGIHASDATVLCTGENGWVSDKTARRAEVARTHRILLLVGDDLSDFVSTAGLTPRQRTDLAMSHGRRWGTAWILLPNPLYGSWERALYPGLTNDDEVLRRKREQVKGFR